MPLNLAASDRKILRISGGVFLFLIAVTLLLAKREGNQDQIPTTYSSGSGGAKAAYLLLKGSGYDVERWEVSLSQLPNPPTTLILAEPMEAPTTEERRTLKQFVEDGGRLIVTGAFVSLFLPESGVISDPLGATTWKRLSAGAPSPITQAAPEITLAPQAHWRPETFAVPLYGDGEQVMVVKYSFGKGEVIWWASATPLTNAGLKEPGNLEFFLACVGREHHRRILWDEYFHGYRQSLVASAAQSPLKWIALQLALFALVIVVTYTRRSGPICLPIAESRLSPLEYVQALGALYGSAGAGTVAVEVCYQRFRYWLTRRLGFPGNASREDLERALSERWGFQDANFSATMQACESAPYDSDLRPRAALGLVRSLYDYSAKLKLFRIPVKEKDGWKPSRN